MGQSRNILLIGVLVQAVLGFLWVTVAGHLSDRVGRKNACSTGKLRMADDVKHGRESGPIEQQALAHVWIHSALARSSRARRFASHGSGRGLSAVRRAWPLVARWSRRALCRQCRSWPCRNRRCDGETSKRVGLCLCRQLYVRGELRALTQSIPQRFRDRGRRGRSALRPEPPSLLLVGSALVASLCMLI